MKINVNFNVINNSNNPLPDYATEGSSGFDLMAMLDKPYELKPGNRKLFKTGLHMAIPVGFELQIRPRSGLAYKHGITVLNAPGTIDSDYRGDIGIILINHGDEAFVIEDGMRIAQGVVARLTQVYLNEVDCLDETERGAGGFGSTGKS